MAQASRMLLISQPAVSKAVKNLESALGQNLFYRNPGALSLTQAGKRLFEFSEELFSKVEDLEQSLLHLNELSGVLRIGTYESLGESIWPDALAHLKKKYPKLLVHLETEGPSFIWSKLRSGLVEMIVDAEPAQIPSFMSKVLYTDRFQIYRSTKHSSIADEVPLPFAYVESAVDRKQIGIREHLRGKGIEHRLMYSVQSFTFVRTLTLKGLCYGVLPMQLAEADVKQGRLEAFKLKGAPVAFGDHRICATFAEHSQDNPRVGAVIQALKQCLNSE